MPFPLVKARTLVVKIGKIRCAAHLRLIFFQARVQLSLQKQNKTGPSYTLTCI